jgi:hypothetical protein
VRQSKRTSSLAVLDVSHKVYQVSLIFYPKDLRSEFGDEMIAIFDEQVSEAYFQGGFTGLLSVWFSVMQEFVTVALPSRIAGHMVPIIAATAALAFMVWFAGYIGYVMETACPGCGQ